MQFQPAERESGDLNALEHKLRQRFAVERFHPWQAEVISALLIERRDALVVAPTGGGKSLCYQFPATELPGTSIVISPLIALMEDQVHHLSKRGIAATWLSSTLSSQERRTRETKLLAGAYRLLYVAPERLMFDEILQMLKRLAPPLVAIDEAHCVSKWGHDFRPDYLRIGEALRVLAPRHVLACTATATPQVREEILRELNFDRQRTAVILRGFARPNLHLSGAFLESSKDQRTFIDGTLRNVLGKPAAPIGGAIIYTPTRKLAEKIATQITPLGFRTGVYHAGLDKELRSQVNRAFVSAQLDVVVATNAFGMGIDRPDIRLVVHAGAPGSIEEYYQEVGRAGRDGQPAQGLLMTSLADFGLRKRLIERGRENLAAQDKVRNAHQWQLFLDLMRYAEAGSCRHDFILRYFEDERELLGGCGHCDVCEALDTVQQTEEAVQVRESEAVIVRKALAGVARAHARAGLQAISDMLRGQENQRIRQLGLHTLSTFGLLAEYDKTWILSLLRRALTADLVRLEGTDYPMPYLTRSGWAVMQAKQPVRILLPPPTPKIVAARPLRTSASEPPAYADTMSEADSMSESDSALFELLRAERKLLAQNAGVPAYIICHDRTLRHISALKPKSLDDLRRAHGMGPARIEAYGAQFLSVVEQHATSS